MRRDRPIAGVVRMVLAVCLLVATSWSTTRAESPTGVARPQLARGTTAPRIPEPQGRFDVTWMGPVEPIAKLSPVEWRPVKGQPDLVLRGLGFTAEGKVRYIVQNHGDVAASQPFVVDLYYNGQRRDTVKHTGLPPLSQQRVESSLANPGGCAQAQLRAMADTQQTVAEASESNNSETVSQVPPCPDLIVRVEQENTDALHYVARIRVTNKGTRATGRHFIVLIREASVPAGVIAAPPRDQRIENLGAGQSTSFRYGGNHLKTTSVHYHAIADRFDDIKESDETNNDTSKVLP